MKYRNAELMLSIDIMSKMLGWDEATLVEALIEDYCKFEAARHILDKLGFSQEVRAQAE